MRSFSTALIAASVIALVSIAYAQMPLTHAGLGKAGGGGGGGGQNALVIGIP